MLGKDKLDQSLMDGFNLIPSCYCHPDGMKMVMRSDLV